jgi:exosortase
MLPVAKSDSLLGLTQSSSLPLPEAGAAVDAFHGKENNGFSIESRTEVVYAILLLSSLILILYGRVLEALAQQWLTDPNYGHGFLVPVFAGYILWRERNRRRDVPIHPSNWGPAIMLFAIGLLVLGTLGSEHFTTRISLLILIAGIIIFLIGWQTLRSVAFPLAYLTFMIPLPAIIYYQLTFPLQLLASRLGANGLVALGVPTVREGNLLYLPNCTLEVVDACSGVRSLLSLLAAVVGYVYLTEPKFWKRCVLVAATIPIVILSNGLRLVATGLLSFFYGPGMDAGLAHTLLGLAFFGLAFLSILLVHNLLRFFSGKQHPAPVH